MPAVMMDKISRGSRAVNKVARWQQLYEDARHDLTKAEMEVERLTDMMQMAEWINP
jgi:hypothetical protein